MAKTKTKKNHPTKRTKIYILGGVAICASLVGALLAYTIYYSSRVLPHVSAAGLQVSGKTLPDTVDALQSWSEAIATRGVAVRVDDKQMTIHAADIGLVVDVKATAAAAYSYGREASLIDTATDLAGALVQPRHVPFVVTYDADKLQKQLDQFAAEVDQPEQNAGVIIDHGTVTETQGVAGKRIVKAEAARAIIDHWTSGQAGDIVLSRVVVQPAVATGDTKEVAKQASQFRTVKITVTTDNAQVSVKQDVLDSWITSELFAGHLQLSLAHDKVKTWLDGMSGQFNSAPVEAKLSIQDGKVTIFSPGSDGKTLDSDKTAHAVVSAARDYVEHSKTDKQISVAATFAVTKPAVTDQSIGALGITDLIGTATTSFATSPENRKHNIAVGASALNGILVKSGDEFSTLKYLGHIDGAAGYLPELVIKENKTEPEFGGGLCQVSTTLFRATMNAGLKITERRNHSYRVGYYEPPVGKDATIYEGSPDFKFINDTPSNILIQSHIDGTKITFDFYGTKDGRSETETDPVVTDIVPPPDPEYIQTDTLPEGTTKQTEHAHNGANASFTYTVLNKDGSVRNKQIFNSHYVPWQARYLVGTAKADQSVQ